MKVQEVIMQLLLRQPFYGNLASALALRQTVDLPEMKITYFPSPTLNFNSEWFEGLEHQKAQAAILHELLHMSLLHPFRKGLRDGMLWEAACDMAVNEFIQASQLSDNAITVTKVERETGIEILKSKNAEYYYDILHNLEDGVSLLDMDKQIAIRISGGQDMLANKQTDENVDSDEISTKAVKTQLYSLVSESLQEGTVPEGLTIQYEDVYEESDVDWRNIFKRFLIGRGRLETRKSYKRESRRHAAFPGNKHTIGLKCLIAIDESGSISNNQVLEFYNEIVGVNRITSAEIFITKFDVTCSEPVRLNKFNLDSNRIKNGGTDFRPVFELADRMKMDLLVLFTDGDGKAPESVNQKGIVGVDKGWEKALRIWLRCRIKELRLR